MKIVVVGETGQVARALAEAAPEGTVFLGRDKLDLENPEKIRDVLVPEGADVVINAAAYTAVDKAEEERERAFVINGEAVGALAAAAAETGAAFVHLSTDYVYPGDKAGLNLESDPVDPINAYGASKLAGEEAALAANPRSVILRTAWVYAPWGKNFVLTMLRLAERERLTVVEDQHGQPTSALDIAEACLAVARRVAEAPADDPVFGVYHYAGAGPTTWAEFARATFTKAKTLGLIETAPDVAGIPTSAYPTPAKRPANSTLDCTRFEQAFATATVPWPDALQTTLERLAANR
ncbi:MAG: dTDP-4-dehydrorhamnose reductase [Pseudomonadota bacterium]